MSDKPDAEDRTEEPTQRRLEEAMKRGDVARSAELTTFVALGALTLALAVGAQGGATSLAADLRAFLTNLHAVGVEGASLAALGRRALLVGLAAMAVPVGLVVVAALAAAGAQHAPMFSFEPLAPKWSRLSPMSGLKRLLGREALVQFLKGLAKIAVVGTVLAIVLWGERDRLDAFARMDVAALLPATLELVLKLMMGVVTIYAFVAAADLLYQRMSWRRRLRMSKQEMKEETKLSEGSPEVKARLRQIRAARFRKRMMASVPKATVIVANPTHYAVALRYEAGMGAPVCVAKGVDALALRIRTLAEEHGVPVVENPPLARSLHATVDIDQEIPVEHYKAVAEVVGYVLRLRRRPA
jgi:flagellar biosynthetic protein FlhB